MLMSAKELIHNHPKPTVEQIKEGLEGNLCRCTGYQQIIEAVLDATGQLTRKEGLEHAGN
jgi:carbon-monoxide dehydrogenase small subunit